MTKVFLFDLDMTLVDTSALAQARRAGQWGIVKANYNLVRPFVTGTIAPHELPAKLAAKGYRVGIVTSSPGWYAQAIVKLFSIQHEVLIAYEDTQNHKPNPDPIELALLRMGVAASDDVYYVGDDVGDFEAAYHAGVRSIGIGWSSSTAYEFSSAAPDILIYKPSRLLRAAPEFDELGYAGERLAAGNVLHNHMGSLLRCEDDPAVTALGRYFTTSDDRHAGSALCDAVLTLKNSDGPAVMFGRAIGEGLKLIGTPFDYVVTVPPKPSQTRNRFDLVLSEAKKHVPDLNVTLDGLRAIKDVQEYKKMNAVEREIAISGAFESKYNWGKKRILLVDDVYTTGSTVKECVKTLKKSGAGSVSILALAKDQRSFRQKICQCGRTMRVRQNSKTGVSFWGCSGYPEQCKQTETM